MLKHGISIDIFRSLRLKHVGLVLASVWVLILVAAVAASIYRNIDAPPSPRLWPRISTFPRLITC